MSASPDGLPYNNPFFSHRETQKDTEARAKNPAIIFLTPQTTFHRYALKGKIFVAPIVADMHGACPY